MGWIWSTMDGWIGLFVLVGLVGFWVWIMYAIRAITRSRNTDQEPPLMVLDRRLAGGQISPEEYQRLRRGLTTGH